jgi:hypothetical protein
MALFSSRGCINSFSRRPLDCRVPGKDYLVAAKKPASLGKHKLSTGNGTINEMLRRQTQWQEEKMRESICVKTSSATDT